MFVLVSAVGGDANRASLILFTPEYWAPVFTLIVGLMGIISQIAINYYSEKRRYELEYGKLYKEALYNFYIPLLSLIRKYKSYQRILSSDKNFSLLYTNYASDLNVYKSFCEFKSLYTEIYNLIQKSYAPINKYVDQEINEFFEHIITVKCIWDCNCYSKVAHDLLEKNKSKGYDCETLEVCLVDFILSEK